MSGEYLPGSFLQSFSNPLLRQLSASDRCLQAAVMGLFDLVIVLVVNLFLKSSGLDLALSLLGVLIFAGMTAWDTQRIKDLNDQNARWR